VLRVYIVPVSVDQLLGCYNENPLCIVGVSTCRLLDFVPARLADLKHELRECGAACRLADNLLFAKTVSETVQDQQMLR